MDLQDSKLFMDQFLTHPSDDKLYGSDHFMYLVLSVKGHGDKCVCRFLEISCDMLMVDWF